MSEQPAAPAAEAPAPAEPAQAKPEAQSAVPEPAEVDWKAAARKWEDRAKDNLKAAESNKAAAERLAQIEDAQKTEAQRQAEALQKAQDAARLAQTDAARLRVAVKFGLGEDSFDLLGEGDEDVVLARGQKLQGLYAAQAELAAVKAELEALKAGKSLPSGTPVVALKPGATPTETPAVEEAYPSHWIPQRAQ